MPGESLSPDLLREYGESIYGPRWQAPLARALGVAQPTIAEWVSGKRRVPPERAGEIVELAAAAALQLFVAETARRCEAEGRMPRILKFRPPPGPAGALAIRMLRHVMPAIPIEFVQ